MKTIRKNIFFSLLFVFSLIAFLFFGILLHKAMLSDVRNVEIGKVIILSITLIAQILGIIFLAILHNSRLFLLLPLGISIFAGAVIFGSIWGTFFALGAPLAYMFWRIQNNLRTRIKMNMDEDVRRPVTTFFVMAIFVASFLIAPSYAPQMQAGFAKMVAEQMPDTMPQNTGGIPLEGIPISSSSLSNQSVSGLIDSLIAEELKRCQGDTGCEELMREEAKKQIGEQVKGTPLEGILDKVDLESDTPLSEEITNQVMGQMLGQFSFGNEKIADTLSGSLWGIIAFLVLSPFAIIFSFLTMIFVRLFYALFRVTGVLHITTKSTIQEIIV